MTLARSLLGERLLSATGFAAVVPFSRKDSFERRAKRPIVERRGGEPLPVLPRPEYFPLTNLASTASDGDARRGCSGWISARPRVAWRRCAGPVAPAGRR